VPFNIVWPADEIRIVSIAGYLVYRISANLARVEVIQNFQLLVQVQFLIQQLHQPLKTACAHIASQLDTVLTSEIHYFKFYMLFDRDSVRESIP
jgi:hypothetical protein